MTAFQARQPVCPAPAQKASRLAVRQSLRLPFLPPILRLSLVRLYELTRNGLRNAHLLSEFLVLRRPPHRVPLSIT